MTSTEHLIQNERRDGRKKHVLRESIETLLFSTITLLLQVYVYTLSGDSFQYPILLLVLGCFSAVFGILAGICGTIGAAKKAATLMPCFVFAILACILNVTDVYYTVFEVYDMTSEVANITTATVVVEAAIGGTTIITSITTLLMIIVILVIYCDKKPVLGRSC